MWSWSFRDLWNLNGYLREDLEQAEASAQAKWATQHEADGTHGDVTADSVHAGQLTTGVYVYTATADNCEGLSSPGTSLVLPPGVSTLVLQIPPGSGIFHWGIHSIEMPGAVAGTILHIVLADELLYIINSAFSDEEDLGFAYYPVGNRISLNNRTLDSISIDGVQPLMYYPETTTGVTLVRVDAYDYSVSATGRLYPAWVQVG
jgi:hypothetical protein